MIKVIVKTTTIRNREVMAEVDSTPAKVFSELGISNTAGSQVNLNGVILGLTDLNSTFTALGYSDGDTVNLNSVVKADGANR